MSATTHDLNILQYNIQKSKTLVAVPLLADATTTQFHILAIQEPWWNPHLPATYYPASCDFYSTYHRHKHTRVVFYINKSINPTTWVIENPSPNLAILKLRVRVQGQVAA